MHSVSSQRPPQPAPRASGQGRVGAECPAQRQEDLLCSTEPPAGAMRPKKGAWAGSVFDDVVSSFTGASQGVQERRQAHTDSQRLHGVYSISRTTKGACARSIQRLMASPSVELSIICLSLLSAWILAYAGPEPVPLSYAHTLVVVHDYVFTSLFSVEAVLRAIGFGREALRDTWFIFDLAVLSACIVDFVLRHMLLSAQKAVASMPAMRLLRLLRAFRVVRLVRTARFHERSRNALRLLAKGTWEARFVSIYVICFVSIMSILGFVWFKDSLRSRCIVALPGTGSDGEGYRSLSDEQVDRLVSGEAWSSVSQTAPILAKPEAYCARGLTSTTGEASLSSLGSHVCDPQTQACVRIDPQDIRDRWAWLQSFDNFGACALCILMMLLNQEWATLALKLLQGTSFIVIPFFVVSSIVAFVLMSIYAGMFHVMFRGAQAQDSENGIGNPHEHEPEPNKGEWIQNGGYMTPEHDKESGATLFEEELQRIRISQKHGCAAAWFYFYWRRLALRLRNVHEFRMQGLKTPLSELVLYCVALMQFVSGCIFSWYVGQWRLIEVGRQVRLSDEVQWGNWGAWSHVRTVCQWLFYVDLVSKLTMYGGALTCMRSSFIHGADMITTIAILVAGFTWQIPDMTTLRGIRLCSGLIRLTSYGDDLMAFYRKLFSHDGDVLHTTLVLLMAALLFQHLSDGLTSENKFFGSWCKSITSVMRLSADVDLLAMIRARMDVDGVAAVVLIIIFTFFLKAVMAKLIIAAMNSGLEDSEDDRIQYQIFLSGALHRHPTLQENLISGSTGHFGYRRILRRARKMRMLEPERVQSTYAESIREKMKISESQSFEQAWDNLTESDKIILVALCMLDAHVEAQKRDENANAMVRAKWIKFTDSFSMSFQEDVFDRLVRGVLTVKKYAALTFYNTKLVFILDLFMLVPIAFIVFQCTSNDDCWVQSGLLGVVETCLLLGFNVEFVAKCVAFGLFREKDAYFKNPQYCFDFLVLIFFWLAFLNAIDVPVQVLYGTRIFRIIQWSFLWLPFIQRSMKCIVSTVDEIFCIACGLCCCICILCPMVLQSYSGRWHHCNGVLPLASPLRAIDCVGGFMSSFPLSANETLLIYRQQSTVNADLNFDDVSSALYTLLVLACADGWSLVFDKALGWSESDLELQGGVQWSVAPLLIYRLLLFVLVWPATVAAYITTERMYDGSGLEMRSQKPWRASINAITLQSQKYVLPDQILWKPAHALSVSPNFSRIAYATIFINIFATVLEFLSTDLRLLDALRTINLCCLIIYWLEMAVMLLASPKHYLGSAWGLFDVAVNLISAIDIALMFASSVQASGSQLQAFRAVRVLRIVRALSTNKHLLLLSRSIGRIALRVRGPASLLILFMASFAVVARHMFASLDDGMTISRQGNAHFRSLAGALVALTRATLGGGMFPLIKDMNLLCPSGGPSTSTSTADSCVTSNEGARLILLMYAIVCQFILWPLLAASVINGFLEEYDEMLSFLSEDDLDKFEKCWRKLDPHCKGYIPVWKLRYFLDQLKATRCSLHFDPHDQCRMKFMNERILDVMSKEPLRMRLDVQEATKKWTQFVARWCHAWTLSEDTYSGTIIHGHVTYKWVAILLLYMREFTHSIPRRPTSLWHRANEEVYAQWVEVYSRQILPKFKRRILTNNAAEDIMESSTSSPDKRSTLTSAILHSAPAICMLEHPRFSIEWLAFIQAKDSGFVHADVHGKEENYVVARCGMLDQDRNEFRSYMSHLLRQHTKGSVEQCKRMPSLQMSTAGATNGDLAPEPDPFLEFVIERPNYDRRIVVFTLGLVQDVTWLTAEKCRQFCSAMTDFTTKRSRCQVAYVPAPGISDDRLSFISQTKEKKAPITTIQKISPVSHGPRLASSSLISFEVLCCDPQVAQEVSSACTQDNVNAQLKRFRLPLARLVADAEILEPTLEKCETMAELIASEGKLSLGFDETIGSNTATIGFVLQSDRIQLKDAHSRYAAALIFATDLALSLNCPEEQIRIQDIFRGVRYTHLVVCITSNDTHDSSAQSLGLQLIRDSLKSDSRVRSIMPSIALVHWMPDRAKAGLSQRYQSEGTESSTRSQLSHLSTWRQERSGPERPAYQPNGAFGGDGILRQAPVDSRGTQEQLGSVPESKWNKLRKVQVHIILHDKMTEAHRIFDNIDTDKSGTLTCQEIRTAMLSNGFQEDEISARLPDLMNSGDTDGDGVLSREEFVTLWVNSRDENPSRLFDRLDLDQNGMLSPAELRAGLLQEGFSENEIHKRLAVIFKQMDVDGNNLISKQEFLAQWDSMRDNRFFGPLAGLVKLPMQSLPALPPGLNVLHTLNPEVRAVPGDEQREPPLGAAGVFSGLMSATSDVFEAVGQSILPDHLQDLMMPLPDTGNGSANDMAGPADRSGRTITRAPASMRRKRLSPREMMFRALAPAGRGADDSAQENRGWAALFRNRLGTVSFGTSEQVCPSNDEEQTGGTSLSLSQGLLPQISLFPPFTATQQPAAGSTEGTGDAICPEQAAVEITSPAPVRVAPSLNARGRERSIQFA